MKIPYGSSTGYLARCAWLLLLLLFGDNARAQSSEIDSLLAVNSSNIHDTTRIKTLVLLAKRLAEKQVFEQAEKHASHALALAEHTKFKPGISQANGALGYIFSIAGDFAKAKKYHEQSYAVAIEIGDALSAAKASGNIGHIHARQGNHKASVPFYKEAGSLFGKANAWKNAGDAFSAAGLSLLNQGLYTESYLQFQESLHWREKSGDPWDIANAHHNLGICLYFQGYFTDALAEYLTALKTREAYGRKRELAESYNDIANIYQELNDFDAALQYYKASLPIFEELNIPQRISLSYHNIANVYSGMGNLDEAIRNLETSIRIKEEMQDKQGLIASYNNIAGIFMETGKLEEAKQALQRAHVFCEETDDSGGRSSTLLNLGRLAVKQGAYSAARSNFNQSLQLMKAVGQRTSIPFVYRHLSALDSLEGNFQLAYQDYKLYKLYEDSISSEKSNERIAAIQAKFETEKKNKEITTLQQAREINDLKIHAQEKALLSMDSERKRAMLENLYHQQQIVMLDNEKAIQQLELDKKQAALLVQQTEMRVKEDQLNLSEQEKALQGFALQRQKVIRNYLFAGVGLLGCMAFLLYRNHVTRQKLKLQTLRNKIASDLHDDVGSTLSSIAIFSEMAQQQSKDTIPLLNTIQDSSRQMLDAMADIVWTINPDNDQFEKIIMRMRNFAFELLGAKQIEFQFTADSEIGHLKLPMQVRKNLYLIFKEATNNLVKYSNATRAQYAITNDGNRISMTIRDNGKGFDLVTAHVGNGLKSMQKRAEEIGGLLAIESRPGQGTFISLQLAL